jgi:hypothetical protein
MNKEHFNTMQPQEEPTFYEEKKGSISKARQTPMELHSTKTTEI